MISRFFIDRPIFATVLSVVITLIGLIALAYLPVAQYPRITPPSVVVQISYPGASSQVVADTVASPIEQQVNGIERVLYMTSQMSNDGTYSLTVTFDIGTNLRTALTQVQNRVALAMQQLPTEVQNQGITIRKKTPDQLMIVSFYSPDGRYDDIYLSNFATINVKDELLRVPGVSDINYYGQRDYSVRAWLDPQKLAARNLTAMDVAQAIRNQNLDAPAGQMGRPPATGEQSFQLTIDTLGRLSDPDQFGDIIIKVGQSRVVRPATSGSARTKNSFGKAASPLSSAAMTLPPAPGSVGRNAAFLSTLRPLFTPESTSVPGLATSGAPTTSGVSTSGGADTSGGGMASGGGTTGGGVTAGTPDSGTATGAMTGLSIASGLAGNAVGSGVLSGETLGRGPGRPSASIVRLKDVARIELGAQNYNQSCTFDGHPAVGLGLYQLPGTNALEVADAVRAKMEELKTRFPEGVEYDTAYDTTPFIRESIQDVLHTLLEAVVLVGIVVLLFLQDWRAMILPMIDVPVSIIGTFAVMALLSAIGDAWDIPWLNFSLNNISLFGLVLAIGIVVDDAIVVLENVERLIATGLDPRTATIKAMEEVTGPIVAVSLVLCAVFVPCAFIGGVTGQFFRQFAVTIAASTVISAINAVTMTPSRAVLIFKADPTGKSHEHRREALPWWIFAGVGGFLTFWLGPHYLFKYLDLPGSANVEEAKEIARRLSWSASACYFAPGGLIGGVIGWFIIRPVNFVLGVFFRAFNRAFNQMAWVYGGTVGLSMRLSMLVLLIYAGLVGLTWWSFQKAPTGFLPQQDQGRLIVNIQLPDSASLERTKDVVTDVVKVARETKGVSHVVAIAGLSFLLQANSPNFASMFIVLDPFDSRQKPELRDTAIMARLRKKWAKIKEAQVTVYGGSPIPGLGTAGGFKLVIEDRGGLGPAALQHQTDELVRKLRGNLPGLSSVATQFRSNTPQLFLDIDRSKAASLGVSLDDVNQTLDMYLGSLYVNSFNEFGRHWQVTIQAEGKFRGRMESINSFKVRNKQGDMVPLGTLVRLKEINGPLTITRFNLYRAASMNGNIATGYSSGDAIKEIEKIAAESLPLSMKADWSELMFLQKRAGSTAFYVFLLAILCVFLALSALYESWSLPLAVILVVPLCLLCSVAGVLYTNRDVNVFVQIGLIVLVGLACKNAILIVEYAKQLHREGRSCFEATKEASRLRLRPILMTSFAFIFGVIPLMVASGAGAEMRRSLGTAVFSGMLGVTLFGIFLTPVFFYVIQGLEENRLFAGVATQRYLTCGLGGSLGMGFGFLLGKLGLVPLLVAMPVGAAAGVIGFLTLFEMRRRARPRRAGWRGG